MKQKKIRKAIFRLAQMYNGTECRNCFLSFAENKCILRHASLSDIAKGCFEKDQEYKGTVWVRFKDREEFKHAHNDVKGRLKAEGSYEVRIYLMNTNEMQEQGLKADEEVLLELIQAYGEDNVKLVIKTPEEVLSYF